MMMGHASSPAWLPAGPLSQAVARNLAPARARYRLVPGRPLPLGLHDCCVGFNFAVFSRRAKRVEPLLNT